MFTPFNAKPIQLWRGFLFSIITSFELNIRRDCEEVNHQNITERKLDKCYERRSETFEKCSISFKIKAREDFNHRNILIISRIKI